MSIALCMVVKNEAERITACLDSVIDIVDEVHIADTGSTDGTPELITKRYGIDVTHLRFEQDRPCAVADPLNTLCEHTRCEWILSLDGDERLAVSGGPVREAIMNSDDSVCGYFGRWRNYVPHVPVFDDYKLFVFRRSFRKLGLIHENAQIDVRAAGGHAQWLDGLVVDHHPEACKLPQKRSLYRTRLVHALEKQPDWLRYHWFLGYSRFLDGDHDEAIHWLDRLREPDAARFPVEALNARMVLIDIAARRGERELLTRLLEELVDFRRYVADDFEVAVNFRLPGWIDEARRALSAGRLDQIRAYRFAY